MHPIAASTCDMDCPLALGATLFALPLHLGHECVAEVLSVGERVARVRPGDRVVVPFQISCGPARPAAPGAPAAAPRVPPVSMYGFGLLGGHWGGAFSDELAVPYADAMLVSLPDGVEPVGRGERRRQRVRRLPPHRAPPAGAAASATQTPRC